VLTGPPNAGKSRLFNALLEADQAIVSPQAGTTRDYLSALCRCAGIMVELIDTAGIENPHDDVAAQAQSMRADQSSTADLVVLCRSVEGRSTCVEALVTEAPVVRVWTKCDLGLPQPRPTIDAILTSAETGMGLDELRGAIAKGLGSLDFEGDLAASTGSRCRDSIGRTAAALASAAQTLQTGAGEELVAFDLRLANDELGKVLGAVVTDDILDRIFQRFCIGK
jgi:tRNA modification GTPase